MNDETDVEDIMLQIKNNIKKRATKETKCMDVSNTEHGELQQDIDYINSNWNIRPEYYISSHRPIIGRFLIWGRRLVHGEIRRYIDQMINKQEEFNSRIAKILNGMNKDIDDKINRDIGTINEDINIHTDKKIIKSDTVEFKNTDKMMNYFVFEEKYRGKTEDIKMRQSIFIEYFKNCQNVLDIGCGRGEFISLLKDNGIVSTGIDIDEDMVLYCKRLGLNVIQCDAINYLQSLKDKSIDGIFLGQVIEHLRPEELMSLIKLCYDKLQYGSYIIAETINPLCITAHQWFYMDLSHMKFIHPETIKFLLESTKFRNIEFKFFSPVPDELKLKRLDITDTKNESKYNIINQNFDKLNQFLYGNQDYAVIGKK